MVYGYVALPETKHAAEKIVARIKQQFGKKLGITIGLGDVNGYAKYPIFVSNKLSKTLVEAIGEFCKKTFPVSSGYHSK